MNTDDSKLLNKYIHYFLKLRRDKKNGGAPHKPILLLSIINLFERNIIDSNKIHITPELVSFFKSNWSSLVTTSHYSNFALPFYHMKSEPFWDLVPNLNCDKWVASKSSMRTFSNLKTAINHALIDIELYQLLIKPISREILKKELLNQYFSVELNSYYSTEYISDSVVCENNSETYRKEIEDLQKQLDENSFQEEVYIRSGIFKRKIPEIYNNTCAISGLRVIATENISMIDACHIVPFSESSDDTLQNGIALSPNLHRAFDRGLISISDEYTVLISSHFKEDISSKYNISQFKNKALMLPSNSKFIPSIENIRNHRNRFNFN